MIWAIVAAVLGLALGVAVVLILARPDSIRSARRAPASTKPARTKPARTRAVPPPSRTKPSAVRTSKVDRSVRLPEPVVAATQATPSLDGTRGADRPSDFPEPVLKAAWRRQGGLCAQCGRLLIWPSRNRNNGTGAWQSHHRIPRNEGGSNDLRNCVLFCSGAANCHFNTGHGGIGWGHYSALDDSGLLYLHFNAEKARETVSQAGTKPGLMGALFGVLGTGKAKPPSARKPRANRPRRSIPLDDDYDEAY